MKLMREKCKMPVIIATAKLSGTVKIVPGPGEGKR
jgi:RNase P/RNase MRP subunit POP5